jgi:hypothetical protein
VRLGRGVLLRGQVALGVQRRCAAGAGGGDRLPVGVVDQVAGGEHAGDVGGGGVHLPYDDVAVGVQLDLSLDQLRARVVAHGDEQAGRREQLLLAGDPVAQPTPSSRSVPTASRTSLSHSKRILSLLKARCCMTLLARSVSRRCTMVTDRAKRVRKVASSTAVSPPPTTTMSWSRKKKPSQVAHQDTPRPDSSDSPGMPRLR